MTTLAAVVQKMFRRGLGRFIVNADWTVAAGSATSVKYFRNATELAGTYKNNGVILWRPGAATAADYIRYAGELTPSTGALAVDTNWADTTQTGEDLYIVKHRVHPEDIIGACLAALGKLYFENVEPLSIKPVGTSVADAGFQAAGTGSFTVHGSTTFTKVTTANSENIFRGIASGKIVNTGANAGIYQRFAVTENEQVIVHALSRLDVGTNAVLALQDASASAVIGTSVSHDQEKWQYMRRSESCPGKLLDVRLLGEGASDEVFWNALHVMPQSTRRLILDTKWESKHRVPTLVYHELRRSTENGVYDAFASEPLEVPSHLYSFEGDRPGANPYALQFFDGIRAYLDKPIFIQGRRAWSDIQTSLSIGDLTTSINIDLDLWEGEAWIQLLEDSSIRKQIPEADRILGEAMRARDDAADRESHDRRGRRKAVSLWGGRLGN